MVIFHGYVGSLKANLSFFSFRYVSNDGRHWFFRSAVSISLSRDSWFRWCKLDLDVSEVLQWLDLEGATGDCRKSICSPIPGGPGGPGGPGAFYPKGIPRIFVSMGPTNELKRSREILEKVEKLKRRHALPRPILFQKAYRTGDEARKDWPEMGCLLWHQLWLHPDQEINGNCPSRSSQWSTWSTTSKIPRLDLDAADDFHREGLKWTNHRGSVDSQQTAKECASGICGQSCCWRISWLGTAGWTMEENGSVWFPVGQDILDWRLSKSGPLSKSAICLILCCAVRPIAICRVRISLMGFTGSSPIIEVALQPHLYVPIFIQSSAYL